MSSSSSFSGFHRASRRAAVQGGSSTAGVTGGVAKKEAAASKVPCQLRVRPGVVRVRSGSGVRPGAVNQAIPAGTSTGQTCTARSGSPSRTERRGSTAVGGQRAAGVTVEVGPVSWGKVITRQARQEVVDLRRVVAYHGVARSRTFEMMAYLEEGLASTPISDARRWPREVGSGRLYEPFRLFPPNPAMFDGLSVRGGSEGYQAAVRLHARLCNFVASDTEPFHYCSPSGRPVTCALTRVKCLVNGQGVEGLENALYGASRYTADLAEYRQLTRDAFDKLELAVGRDETYERWSAWKSLGSRRMVEFPPVILGVERGAARHRLLLREMYRWLDAHPGVIIAEKLVATGGVATSVVRRFFIEGKTGPRVTTAGDCSLAAISSIVGIRDGADSAKEMFARLRRGKGYEYGTLKKDSELVNKLRIGAMLMRLGPDQGTFDADPCGYLARETSEMYYVILAGEERHSIVVNGRDREIWDGIYSHVLQLTEASLRLVAGHVGVVGNRRIEGSKMVCRRILWLDGGETRGKE